MPSADRRSTSRRRHKPRGVKVVPYVVPTTRSRPAFDPVTVPTRWVKNVIAVFLLPACAILSQTFFTAFARATVAQRLWAGAEFWFFSLGVVLWLIAFFGLPRAIRDFVPSRTTLSSSGLCGAEGSAAHPVPREPRRRTHRNEPHEFFHRARALFFSALQHSRPRRLRIAQSFLQRATLRAIALRRRWRDLVVSFHVHLLDDSEESDRPARSRHVLLARRHLPNESGAAQRDADCRVAANHIRQFWPRSDCESYQFLAMGRRLSRSIQPRRGAATTDAGKLS